MSTQENVPKIYAAMSNIQKELAKQGISKDRKNTMQNYSFRSIDDIYKHISPLMAEHGVIMQHSVISQEQSSFTNAKQTLMFHTIVTVEYTYISVSDGSSMQTRCIGEAMDSSDKSTNKAISAAFKYNALNTFCIPVEGMEDADAETPEVGVVTKPTTVNAPPKQDDAKAIINRMTICMGHNAISKDTFTQITGLETMRGKTEQELFRAEQALTAYVNRLNTEAA